MESVGQQEIKKKPQCLHPQGGEKQDIAFPQTDWAFRHERPMLIAMKVDVYNSTPLSLEIRPAEGSYCGF